MFVLSRPKSFVFAATLACLLVQVGFALGVFGPAWLSPILTLPALALVATLWRRAEQENQQNQAFNRLVI